MAAEQDVSEVFARNLRDLMADRRSISAVCRDLEINRTQFNRYLSGEAHPRPEVLARICAYFGCDARILLTPLSEIARVEASEWPYPDDPNPFRTLREDFDHARLPDGLYQIILPNMVMPGALVVELVRFFTTDAGVKGMHWSVHKPYAESIGAPTAWSHRKLTGYVTQHIDGVSFLATNPISRLIMLCFVTLGHRGMPTVHTGYAALTQAAGPLQSQLQPLLLRKVTGTCGDVLAARRKQAGFTLEDLPPAQRTYIETWSAP